MPDISMCQGINCNIKDNCHRFKAKPSEFRQSWFSKSPNIDKNNCDYYWEITKPIHKFNNGKGATLCHKCSKIISTGFIKDLYCSSKCEEK
jgi:hypothetical protein